MQGPFATRMMLGWVQQEALEPSQLRVRRGETGDFGLMEEVFPLYAGLTGQELVEQRKARAKAAHPTPHRCPDPPHRPTPLTVAVG